MIGFMSFFSIWAIIVMQSVKLMGLSLKIGTFSLLGQKFLLWSIVSCMHARIKYLNNVESANNLGGMMERIVKEEIFGMVKKEAAKRGLEFKRIHSGRSYQFSVGKSKGIIKLTEGSQKYPDIFWVGVMLKTLDELGENSFLIVVDEVFRNYLVIPFNEIKNWNRHKNLPLVSATIRRVGGGYMVVPTKYVPNHVARIGSPEALSIIFETATKGNEHSMTHKQ